MKLNLKRVACGAVGFAAFAAASGVLPAGSANAGNAADPPNGAVTLSPPNGTSATAFVVQPPTAAACPGTGDAGYRVSSYIAPVGTPIGNLRWSASGVPLTAGVKNLTNSAGTALKNVPPTIGDNFINPVTASFFASSWSTLAPGAYNLGLVCHVAEELGGVGTGFTIETKSFYNAPITITSLAGAGPNNFNYAFGAVPAAPVLSPTVTYNPEATRPTVATVSFTHAGSTPATTGYTATVTQTAGPAAPIAPIVVPAGATSFQIPGLDPGETYSVTLVASNSTGNSAASNAVTVTGDVTVQQAPPTPTSAFFNNAFTLSWIAPTPAPASYNVAITGAGVPAGYSFAGVTGTSQVFPAGLPVGSYSATVTPIYAAGSGVTGSPGVSSFNITPNTLVVQEITVTRPPGALILTQRCGVYGPLNPFVAVDAFPGFPRNLVLETASANQIGTSPDIDLVTPGVQVDPEFGNYPDPAPARYPTKCGLSMGTARFVTSGALAGQFYTASGRLNQVTVLDTRDTDTGWIARGDIEDNFTGTTGNTFSGDYLGWIPQVTDTSDPVGGSAYDQVVTPGSGVLPGTVNGLRGNPILGESPLNAGLGIATMDARMQLLIPASADAADYSATLSLTVVPRP